MSREPVRHSGRYSRWAVAAMVAASAGVIELVILLFVMHGRGWGPVDDAYISLRYARNWAEGLGLTYNPGEVVEGYTNFLMVALEALAIRVGVSPVFAMSAISVSSSVALTAVVALFVWRHVYPGRALLASASGVLIGVNPIVLAWAVSGMESGLLALLVLAAVMSTLSERAGVRTVGSGALASLAAMTRPEAVLLIPLFSVVIYVRRRSLREVLFQLGLTAVLFGSYFTARAVHFGALLPNTYYAKVGDGGAALAWRGLTYLGDFAAASPLLLAFCAVTLVRMPRGPAWTRILAGGASLLCAAVVWEGGDHFPLFRFMVPVVPILGLLALYPSAELLVRRGGRSPATRAAIGVTLLTLGMTDLTTDLAGTRIDATPMSHRVRFGLECALAREWSDVGRWLAHDASPGASVATVAIGAVGYHSELRVIDPAGLIDPDIARRPLELGHGYAGHEKYDVDRVLGQEPTYILVVHYLTPTAVLFGEIPEYAWGGFNREVLQDAHLKAHYEYRVAPIGDRFLNYFIHRSGTT